MRFWIGKRLELPIIGGVYTGVSMPFHPERLFVPHGSKKAESNTVANAVVLGLGIGGILWVCFWLLGR